MNAMDHTDTPKNASNNGTIARHTNSPSGQWSRACSLITPYGKVNNRIPRSATARFRISSLATVFILGCSVMTDTTITLPTSPVRASMVWKTSRNVSTHTGSWTYEKPLIEAATVVWFETFALGVAFIAPTVFACTCSQRVEYSRLSGSCFLSLLTGCFFKGLCFVQQKLEISRELGCLLLALTLCSWRPNGSWNQKPKLSFDLTHALMNIPQSFSLIWHNISFPVSGLAVGSWISDVTTGPTSRFARETTNFKC